MADELMMSRHHRYKRDVDRHANWLLRNGAKYVKVMKVAGQLWRVSAKVPLTLLAKFVAWEANIDTDKDAK